MLMVLLPLSAFSQHSTTYQYEIYTQPTCTYCPKEKDFKVLNEMGWGTYIVHYPNGDPSCTAYPTFKVTYKGETLASSQGQMTTRQIGDFFNKTYYAHYLSTEHSIETEGMTLSQLESINRAIAKIRSVKQ